MSLPLHFPDPNVQDKYTDNGVTYYWDPVTSSWVLITSQSVNKNYVDSRDQLRYRRDGNDFIYGDVHVKEENSTTSQSNVKLKTDGAIVTARESHLIFSSLNSPLPGRISYGVEENPTTLFFLTDSFVRPTVEFRVSTEDTDTFSVIENYGQPEVVLFDVVNYGGSSNQNDACVYLDNSEVSNFVVKIEGETDGVKLNSKGRVIVTHSDEKSLVVTNKMSTNDPPFTVNAHDHKILASEQYSEALRSRNQGGNVTGPDGSVFHSYKEDNLLVTKGYVDDRVGGSPGRTVCADREEDAEIGGFWWDGRGLFLRVG